MPGPEIDGYRDFRLIAVGGFSTVYIAYQEKFARTVAVKVIDADAGAVETILERQASGLLSDPPEVATVFDAGVTSDQRPYIAMRYFPAGSLADRLRRDGPLSVPQVVEVGAALARALASAHEAGIVHRDVKPGNILISSEGRAVLSDFGVATIAAGADSTTGPSTPTFIGATPETLEGQPPGPASDIYALGSTLHTLLSGTPPFLPRPGDEPDAVLQRIREGAADRLGDHVPAELRLLIGRMMDVRPEDRPDAAGLVVEFESLRETVGTALLGTAPERSGSAGVGHAQPAGEAGATSGASPESARDLDAPSGGQGHDKGPNSKAEAITGGARRPPAAPGWVGAPPRRRSSSKRTARPSVEVAPHRSRRPRIPRTVALTLAAALLAAGLSVGGWYALARLPDENAAGAGTNDTNSPSPSADRPSTAGASTPHPTPTAEIPTPTHNPVPTGSATTASVLVPFTPPPRPPASLTSSPTPVREAPNHLADSDFETNPRVVYTMLLPVNNRVHYCNDVQPAHSGACFVEFNGNGPNQTSIRQDIPMVTAYGRTIIAAAMVRCPTSNQGAQCVADLAIWGDADVPGRGEARSVQCRLPSDGRWYAVRLQGVNPSGNGSGSFSSIRHSIRWELYNRTPILHLDVDDAFVAYSDEGTFPQPAPTDQICATTVLS